jgi:hypothetical protein
MIVAFPDVCITPPSTMPSGRVPIPYPSVARAAVAKQQQKASGAPAMKKLPTTSGRTAPGNTGVVSSKVQGPFVNSFDVKVEGKPVARLDDLMTHNVQMEAAQLRNILNDLNQRMQRLPAGKPDEWQAVLQGYAVAASALYVTITDDD